MNDWINSLIATLFERFRTKYPQVAVAIIVVALTTAYFADQGELLGVFTLPLWLAPIVKWVGIIAASLVSPRVTAFLPAKLRIAKEQDYIAQMGTYFGSTKGAPRQEEQERDREKARSDIQGRSQGGQGRSLKRWGE